MEPLGAGGAVTNSRLLPTGRIGLAQLERIIERGRRTFIKVGQALLEIRDSRLYRDKYSTFDEYCRERWGWSRNHAHRQIEAAKVVALLPMGNTTPANERQARALAPLAKNDPDHVAGLWSVLLAKYGDKLTTETVKRAVDEHMRRKGAKDRDVQAVRDLTPVPKPGLHGLAEASIRKAKGIVADDEHERRELLEAFEKAEREGRDVTEQRRNVVAAYRKAAERAGRFADDIEMGIRCA